MVEYKTLKRVITPAIADAVMACGSVKPSYQRELVDAIVKAVLKAQRDYARAVAAETD